MFSIFNTYVTRTVSLGYLWLGKFKPEVQQWFLTSFSTMNVEKDEGIADGQIEQKPENISVPLS